MFEEFLSVHMRIYCSIYDFYGFLEIGIGLIVHMFARAHTDRHADRQIPKSVATNTDMHINRPDQVTNAMNVCGVCMCHFYGVL